MCVSLCTSLSMSFLHLTESNLIRFRFTVIHLNMHVILLSNSTRLHTCPILSYPNLNQNLEPDLNLNLSLAWIWCESKPRRYWISQPSPLGQSEMRPSELCWLTPGSHGSLSLFVCFTMFYPWWSSWTDYIFRDFWIAWCAGISVGSFQSLFGLPPKRKNDFHIVCGDQKKWGIHTSSPCTGAWLSSLPRAWRSLGLKILTQSDVKILDISTCYWRFVKTGRFFFGFKTSDPQSNTTRNLP